MGGACIHIANLQRPHILREQGIGTQLFVIIIKKNNKFIMAHVERSCWYEEPGLSWRAWASHRAMCGDHWGLESQKQLMERLRKMVRDTLGFFFKKRPTRYQTAQGRQNILVEF